jgi:[acyl-carrier-protein] S-malonyltransferase
MAVGFIFPGQGSQSLGMLKDLAQIYTSIVATFSEASQELGYDLWDLVQNGPEDQLNATERTQPAMLAAGVALWRVWQEQGGVQPRLMAGHSLGEYSALVCAGAIGFREAISVVADRGRYMQEAVARGRGGMAAILGLADHQVAEVCQSMAQGEVVACANFNSPGQVVIAGQMGAIERAVEYARARGAKRAVILPVSVPSHCELMRPAAQWLFARLQNVPIARPAISVIHNVDTSIRPDPKSIVQALVEQLYKPVRWVEVIQKMVAEGIHTVVECGPGKVLTGLCKRIDHNLHCLAVLDSPSLDAALQQVN